MTAIIDDEVLSEERVIDPYPYFAQLREHDPVHWNDTYRAWFIHRYDDVLDALKDSRFSSDRIRPVFEHKLTPEQKIERGFTYQILGDWLVFRDPPDHTRLRKLVGRAFTPRAVEGWRAMAERVVDDMIESLAGREEIDLITEFAYPIPAVVIAEILGVPPADRDLFKEWSDDIMVLVFGARGMEGRRERAQQGLKEMADYLGKLIVHHRKKPADNIISALVHAQEHGQALTDHEIVANCVLFLFGGHETTTNLIGNGINALLDHPGELAKLRRDPAKIKPAIEEILRYDGPSKMQVRTMGETVELRGKTLKKGDMVYFVQAAAHRDPLEFDQPDRFDIDRNATSHVAFGFGLHFCLGASLARLEGSIAIDRFVRAFPQLGRGSGHTEWVPTMLSRGMHHLPVALT